MGVTSLIALKCDRCSAAVTVRGTVQTSSVQGSALVSFTQPQGWNTFLWAGRNACVCPVCHRQWQELGRQQEEMRTAFFTAPAIQWATDTDSRATED